MGVTTVVPWSFRRSVLCGEWNLKSLTDVIQREDLLCASDR